MRMGPVWICCLVLSSLPATASANPQAKSNPAQSQTKQPASAASPTAETESAKELAGAKLPVRRVVLYKTGVGYFELSDRFVAIRPFRSISPAVSLTMCCNH